MPVRHSTSIARLALALSFAWALGACGAGARGTGVVVFASGTDLESGNPLVTIHSLSRQLQRYAVFTTLARFDSLLVPTPYAARSWTWSPDRRSLTLHLVTALRWHDGPPTTARDVAFTLLAARDPRTGYPRSGDLSALDSVLAPDDSTAVLRFRSPQNDFPPVLCELPVLPQHLLGGVPRQDMRRAPFSLAPVGNGPFRFVERVAGQRWRFTRNEAFPPELGGAPVIAELVVAVVDEPTTKFAGLASGDLDFAGIAPSMAALAQRDPTLRVVGYPVLFSTALVFNVHRPPFDDARVRRAVDLALDRPRIVAAALAGYGRPAWGPVPPENPFAQRDERTRDTRAADSLLDAAGWRRGRGAVRERGGMPFVVELWTVGSGDNAIEQLVQADLGERGITLKIRQLELGAFLARARANPKTFDALLTGIPGDVSLAYLGAMYDSRQRGGSLDYADYHTPRLDSLFDRTRSAPALAARSGAWRDVQAELVREMPAAWIYHARGLQGMSRRMANVRMDIRGELVSVAQWSIAPR